jgi:hypothetical protein
MAIVKLVENGVQARREIEQLILGGFEKDDIYLLAHDKNRSEDLSDSLEVNEIGVPEQGVVDAIANVFRTRGDELRTKLESLGLTSEEAERYEGELDHGKVVVVAAPKSA